MNAIRKARGEKELDAIEFLKLVKEKAKELKFDEEKLNRQLNVGFSGGEKKKNEILQMSILDPKLSILCLLYTSPSPRDRTRSRMPSSA